MCIRDRLGAAHLWGVPDDDPRIEEAARSLGADVAFFLHGGCACFTGVGDAFDHALAPMNGNVVLVKPEGGVSTAAAYRAFDEHPTAISEDDREAALEAQRAADVPLRNNLVPVSEHLLPALVDIRLWASERADVQRVLMSGSGSAVFMQCATCLLYTSNTVLKDTDADLPSSGFNDQNSQDVVGAAGMHAFGFLADDQNNGESTITMKLANTSNANDVKTTIVVKATVQNGTFTDVSVQE